MNLNFTVLGVPVPQGSKTAMGIYVGKKGSPDRRMVRATMREANPATRPWRQLVALEARRAVADSGFELQHGPVLLDVEFVFPRPKAHYRRDGSLKDGSVTWKTSKPDLSKLVRAIEDSLTNVVWHDDSQVVTAVLSKRYVNQGEEPRAKIHVVAIPQDGPP